MSDNASEYIGQSNLTSKDDDITGALAETKFPSDFEAALSSLITVSVNDNTSDKMMEKCQEYAEGLCMF